MNKDIGIDSDVTEHIPLYYGL